MNGTLRVIVTGLIGQYPLGGVTWDYLQYVLGLHRMGHDVYYLEDTGMWPYDPREGGLAEKREEYRFNVRYVSGVMEQFGLGERWCYYFEPDRRWYGIDERRREKILNSADLLINISGTLGNPFEYRQVKRLAYVDSDPVFTQIKLLNTPEEEYRAAYDLHDVHFSFGERVRERWPDTGYDWLPTRQPVVLDEWTHNHSARDAFTTVMNWTSYEGVEYEGETYGQKNEEFERFLDLPERVKPATLEVAVNEGKTEQTPRERLSRRGWRVVDPDRVCPDLGSYRRYLQRSRAEWSVQKNAYVKGNPGWFSCRSACYLAAGRPVVVQDTGFGGVLPTGRGVLSFSTPREAAEAVEEVRVNYPKHARDARSIAEEFFDAERVLGRLLDRAGAVKPGSTA